ncbi:MAG: D-ribose pyranase [Fusobacteriaceae bacterium]
MKKIGMLNSELSYEISKLGHTQHITLCDAGLPIPKGIKRIDLAIVKGLPSFIEVLQPILLEMKIEEIILAHEIEKINPKMLEEIKNIFKLNNIDVKITMVSHEELKKITHSSEAIVRTGECSPYANIILKSGVVF